MAELRWHPLIQDWVMIDQVVSNKNMVFLYKFSVFFKLGYVYLYKMTVIFHKDNVIF